MKKPLLAFAFLLSIIVSANAQDGKNHEGDSNCYMDWAKVFEARGADDVADGSYPDVIITIRSGSDADCFYGKCDVKDNKVIAMYVRLEDGKFELLKRKLRYDFPITINNGISKTVLTMEDELINVLFTKKIKPKKAGFEKAAGPGDF